MKLGEMLIRDGRLSEAQLDRALARQAQGGGRLGTVMVEMGLIDVDTLTVYLGLELGIPMATGAALERAKRTAVRLLTPAQARHYRCIPLIVQDRQLIAAIDDPHDFEALDELYRLTGYRIIPRVAPEIRIFYYLERYYGLPRPARFSVFGDTVRGRTTARDTANLPPPPLPGLPPHVVAPQPRPQSRPIIVMPAAAPTTTPPSTDPAPEPTQKPTPEPTGDAADAGGPDSPAGEELTSEAESLVSTLDADKTARAETAPPHPEAEEAEVEAESREHRAHEIYTPLPLGPAIEAMKSAVRRGDVADAIMSYAVGIFDVTALCVVRDNMAFGWKAHGPDIDRSRVEVLLIPLEAPSMFRIAIHGEDLFHAAPFPATLHAYLYRVLQCQPPQQATVAAISIGKRVVNLLYGHRVDRGELTESELDGLRNACQAASDAYVQLIATSKGSGQRA